MNIFARSFSENTRKFGKDLFWCYELALKRCESIKTMVENQIEFEFPIDTFVDKNAEKIHKTKKN